MTTLGTIGIAYFWVFFDATVATENGGRVWNTGLMQDRLLGLIVSLGLAAAGVALLLTRPGRLTGRRRALAWIAIGVVAAGASRTRRTRQS